MSKPETKQADTKAAALAALAGGLSVIPIGADKRPIGSWEKYESERAKPAEIVRWLDKGGNFAIVCGAVSGGLLVLDFDAWAVWLEFKAAYPDLVAGLPIVKTGKGAHVYMRCAAPGRNTKLAKRGGAVVIETRAEGGYVVAPPSLHPSGAVYTLLAGDLAQVPTVAQERAEQMLKACRLMGDDAGAPASPVAARANGQGKPAAGLNGTSKHAAPADTPAPTAGRVQVSGDTFRDKLDSLRELAFGLGLLIAGKSMPRERAERELTAAAAEAGLDDKAAKPAIEKGLDAGALYIERAIEGEAERVRGAAQGARNDDLNKAAYSLGKLVAGGVLSRSEAEQKLMAAAAGYIATDGEVAALKTIKSGLDAGEKKPRRPASKPARRMAVNGQGKPAASGQGAGAAADLLDDDGPAEHEPYTDLGNGRRLASRHADKLRYVAEWGWLVWDGRRWLRDTDGAAMRFAKETALAIQDNEVAAALVEYKAALDELTAADLAGDKDALERAKERAQRAGHELKDAKEWAKASQMSHRLDAMLKLGASEIELAAKAEWFDANPYLLNCLNGVLDLRAGALAPHSRDDLITRLVPIEYDAKAKAPLWLAFLERTQAGDKSMISFLQRAVGYSLSGLTEEHALLFMYGSGANGKSVFGNALADLLGDYARKTRAETLLAKRQDANSNEVAALAGARLVVAAELPQERRLNEALVKDLTGGDMMTARFLYKELFEFRPIFKLWLYGNHKPIVRGTDDGIWRRLKVIPFTVTIPPKERDKKLSQKLRAELAGILAWAVRGFGEWEKRGLDEPDKVQSASANYRAEQDTLGQFLAQACELDEKALIWASELYTAYERFAGKGDAMTPQAFGRQLTERGFVAGKGTGGIRVWRGLRLAEAKPETK